MAFNGSGTFNRTNGVNTGSTLWAADRDDGTNILATRHDTQDQDIADGLTNCITKDGQTTVTADLPMSGQKHLNVGNAALRNQYAATGQVQDSSVIWGGTSTGSADVHAIAPSPSITAYASGQAFFFKAGYTNTGSATINVNAVGAVTMKKIDGATNLDAGDIVAGKIYQVVHDTAGGGVFNLMGTSAAGLEDIADISRTDGNIIVGDGTNWVGESGATARTSLGLGSIATQASDSVSITGGSVTGITDLAIADGGTAASSASAARTNLGLAIGTDVAAAGSNSDITALTNCPSITDNAAMTIGSSSVGSGTIQFKVFNANLIQAGHPTSSDISPNTTNGANLGDTSYRYNGAWITTVSPFTGCHYAEEIVGSIEVGDPVIVTNDRKLQKATEGDSSVAGIYYGEHESAEGTIYQFAAVGDNEAKDLQGFSIESSDFIPRGTLLKVGPSGKLVPQDDDIVRSTTVGKTFVDASPVNGVASNVYGAIYAG